MYALPVMNAVRAQWEALEIFQHIALNLCYGLISVSLNFAMLLEPNDSSHQLVAEERPVGHLERIKRMERKKHVELNT